MAPGTSKAANPLRDKLDDDTLDLSLMQLADVPVNYIADLPKGTTLDLSNNMLVQLPESFPMLTHLVKLDLSKNQLRELPEFFGHLRLLRHLDLYSNQLQRLPVSFAQLKNLKWLDLKHNPLVPALQQAAGPCITPADCAMCAKKVVALLQSMESQLERERQKLALEEQRAEASRREAEEREREKLRAEKRAAKEKRREEARQRDSDVQKRKIQPDGDGHRANGRHADSLDAEDDYYSLPLEGQKAGRSQKGRGCCWSLLMFLTGVLLVCLASGISLLWIYTGGHLDQKSIGKAVPAIRKDAGGVFVSVDAIYQERLAPFVQSTWAELSRRHEAVTVYVNKNLGPSFCALTASAKQYWAWAQTRVHDAWTWLKPQLNAAWVAARPHFHALGEAVIRFTTSVFEIIQKAAPVYWDWIWHKCAYAVNYVATAVDSALNG